MKNQQLLAAAGRCEQKEMQIELESSSTLAEAAYDEQGGGGGGVIVDKNKQEEEGVRNYGSSAVIATDQSYLLTELRDDMVNIDGIVSPIEGAKVNGKQEHTNNKIPFVYCDHTASNRALHSIEEYIHRNVLPLYANVHTTTSTSGSQCTALVSESRTIIAEACNARITGKASRDVVLFTGSGATSAVELALHLTLKCKVKLSLSSSSSPPPKKVIVYAGPMEHHSNLLPYRESDICEVVNVPPISGHHGGIDLKVLEDLLKQENSNGAEDNTCLKIGVFSAASNVTGMLCQVVQITRECWAQSCFDLYYN